MEMNNQILPAKLRQTNRKVPNNQTTLKTMPMKSVYIS